MRLVTYRAGGTTRAGALTAAGVLDAAEVLGIEETGVRELIADGGVEELRDGLEGTDASPIAGAALLPPLPDPDKIVCIGLNYRSHAAEAGIDPPDQPTFFAKFRNALAPADATVKLPAASEKVDYEAEVAFVLGRRCKDVERLRCTRRDRRVHASQRPLRPGPSVRHTAVDARQGLRRLGAVRSRSGHAR